MNLFDDKFRYTDKASNFEKEIYLKINDIVSKYYKEGCSPRELQILINNVAFDICTNFVLVGIQKNENK